MSRHLLLCHLFLGSLLGVVHLSPAADAPKVQFQSQPLRREDRIFPGFADVVEKVAPSVVTVTSSKMIKEDSRNPMMNDPLLRRFFGQDNEPDGDESPGSR